MHKIALYQCLRCKSPMPLGVLQCPYCRNRTFRSIFCLVFEKPLLSYDPRNDNQESTEIEKMFFKEDGETFVIETKNSISEVQVEEQEEEEDEDD